MPAQELIIGQIQIWVSIIYKVLCFIIYFSLSNHGGTWKEKIKIVTFKNAFTSRENVRVTLKAILSFYKTSCPWTSVKAAVVSPSN